MTNDQRLSLFDEEIFEHRMEQLMNQAAELDVHDNQALIAFGHLIEDTFIMEESSTRLAVGLLPPRPSRRSDLTCWPVRTSAIREPPGSGVRDTRASIKPGSRHPESALAGKQSVFSDSNQRKGARVQVPPGVIFRQRMAPLVVLPIDSLKKTCQPSVMWYSIGDRRQQCN